MHIEKLIGVEQRAAQRRQAVFPDEITRCRCLFPGGFAIEGQLKCAGYLRIARRFASKSLCKQTRLLHDKRTIQEVQGLQRRCAARPAWSYLARVGTIKYAKRVLQ